MVQINNEWMCTAILENQFGGAFCKNIEIVDKSSFYKKDIKQMEKGTDIFNSIIMRKEAGMAVLRVQ